MYLHKNLIYNLSILDASITLTGDFASQNFEVLSVGGKTTVALASIGATRLTPAGERFITTDAGENRVYGDHGDDVAVTSAGNDLISGGDGFDVILAGAGDDVIIGGRGGDIATGGAGADVFSFDASDYETGTITADFVKDFEVGVDIIELTGFGFTGLADLSFQTVATGDAIVLGNGSFIVLEGISASDLSASDITTSPFARDMSLISVSNAHYLSDANDRFITTDPGANEVFAGSGIDAVIGGLGDDILRGQADDDVLIGGGGNDRLIGGQGNDRLTGRDGADRFEFTSGEETGFTADFVTDFEAGDMMVLQGYGFADETELTFGATGAGDVTLELSATHFVVFEGISDETELAGAFEFV